MNYYWLKTALGARGGSLKWSETKEERQIDPNANRWYVTDADRAPLGPFPGKILEEISDHWALSFSQNDSLPDTFGSLNSFHFTGAPFAKKAVCDVFVKLAEGNCEVIEMEKIWSLHDDAKVPERYFVVNAAEVVDYATAPIGEVKNPKIGKQLSLRTLNVKKFKVKNGAFSGRHLLRDAKTSEWFCDDVFREEIENTTPGTYKFNAVATV
ncbi:hypothetical protein [Parasedimentitalea maritima]|nr:hypothetical protein [Zongyanglinia marina]